MKTYKYCIVPTCRNTTKTTPSKIFFDVPKDSDVRKKWCIAIRRTKPHFAPLSAYSTRHCCEDHFNIEEDTENFIKYKLMSSHQKITLRLKKDVLPREKGYYNKPVPERSAFAKRRRQELISDALGTPYRTGDWVKTKLDCQQERKSPAKGSDGPNSQDFVAECAGQIKNIKTSLIVKQDQEEMLMEEWPQALDEVIKLDDDIIKVECEEIQFNGLEGWGEEGTSATTSRRELTHDNGTQQNKRSRKQQFRIREDLDARSLRKQESQAQTSPIVDKHFVEHLQKQPMQMLIEAHALYEDEIQLGDVNLECEEIEFNRFAESIKWEPGVSEENEGVCRTCLCPCEDGVSLSERDEDLDATLGSLLAEVAGVVEHDQLPRVLCDACSRALRAAAAFRRRAIRADTTLRDKPRGPSLGDQANCQSDHLVCAPSLKDLLQLKEEPTVSLQKEEEPNKHTVSPQLEEVSPSLDDRSNYEHSVRASSPQDLWELGNGESSSPELEGEPNEPTASPQIEDEPNKPSPQPETDSDNFYWSGGEQERSPQRETRKRKIQLNRESFCSSDSESKQIERSSRRNKDRDGSWEPSDGDTDCHSSTDEDMDTLGENVESSKRPKKGKKINTARPRSNTALIPKKKRTYNNKLQCFECGKLYVNMAKLNIHMRRHTGERPFKCPECGRQFRCEDGLNKHLQTHKPKSERARKFICAICGRDFYKRFHLTQHLATHSNPQFVCQSCGHAFAWKHNLKAHKKRVHGEQAAK